MIKKYVLIWLVVIALIVPVITLASPQDEDNDSEQESENEQESEREDQSEINSNSNQQKIAELQAKIKELMRLIAQLRGENPNRDGNQCRLELTQDLFFGDEDTALSQNVKTLQKLLEKHGYFKKPEGAQWGFFGRLTLAAVARFQATRGINELWKDNVNYVGPQTRRALSGCENN